MFICVLTFIEMEVFTSERCEMLLSGIRCHELRGGQGHDSKTRAKWDLVKDGTKQCPGVPSSLGTDQLLITCLLTLYITVLYKRHEYRILKVSSYRKAISDYFPMTAHPGCVLFLFFHI